MYKRQAFNADFDGDQMAVHLPLTAEAPVSYTHLDVYKRPTMGPGVKLNVVKITQ